MLCYLYCCLLYYQLCSLLCSLLLYSARGFNTRQSTFSRKCNVVEPSTCYTFHGVLSHKWLFWYASLVCFTLAHSFFGLLAIVHRDLNYARRQLQIRRSNGNLPIPSTDLQYFERATDDADAAALSLGQLIETHRVQHNVDKRISPHRFKWVLQGEDRFISRQGVLQMAHNSLLAAIQKIDTSALVPTAIAPPPYSSTTPASSGTSRSGTLRSPSQQRILKGKSSMILPYFSESPSASQAQSQANRGSIGHVMELEEEGWFKNES